MKSLACLTGLSATIFCIACNTTAIHITNRLEKERKEWIYLVRDEEAFSLCLFYDRDRGYDSCEDSNGWLSPLFAKWQGDLNEDGFEDYILVNQSGRYTYEVDYFMVLLGSKNGSYMNGGEFHATSISVADEKTDGFSVLIVHSECRQEGFPVWDVNVKAVFDTRTLKYKIPGLEPDEASSCTLNR